MAALLLSLFLKLANILLDRCFGDFSVGVFWKNRPVKNNGRGVNFQCRKGVSFRVASNNHTKTIMAAQRHRWFL
jgi:hypothetical protein